MSGPPGPAARVIVTFVILGTDSLRVTLAPERGVQETAPDEDFYSLRSGESSEFYFSA